MANSRHQVNIEVSAFYPGERPVNQVWFFSFGLRTPLPTNCCSLSLITEIHFFILVLYTLVPSIVLHPQNTVISFKFLFRLILQTREFSFPSFPKLSQLLCILGFENYFQASFPGPWARYPCVTPFVYYSEALALHLILACEQGS